MPKILRNFRAATGAGMHFSSLTFSKNAGSDVHAVTSDSTGCPAKLFQVFGDEHWLAYRGR